MKKANGQKHPKARMRISDSRLGEQWLYPQGLLAARTD